MATPTPTIPTFTDGQIVHAVDLNALASNLTNLYNYNQASFNSQRPCVIAKNTTGGNVPTLNGDYIVPFQSAAVNTDNMWTASVPTQLTVQHAGIYLVFSQSLVYNQASPTYPNCWFQSKILVNGTNSGTNAVTIVNSPFNTSGDGIGIQNATIANLAAGSTVFLDWWIAATAGPIGMNTNLGSSFLGAIFLTSST